MTVSLCWGLYNDQACAGVLRPNAPHLQNAWNPPSVLQSAMIPDTPTHIYLGWTHALLLTQDGYVFAAKASQVYESLTATDVASQNLVPVQPGLQHRDDQGSNSGNTWQAVHLQHGPARLRNAVKTALKVVQIATGDSHCLMLDSAGCVWAMGSNSNGQLGSAALQHHQEAERPPPQQPLAGAAAVEAAPAQAGSTQKWEGSTMQQEQLPSQQQTQRAHEQQQISSSGAAAQDRPVCVLGPGSPSSIQEHIQQVAAGACHSVAVTAGLGRLYSWGWNAHGQCGTGDTNDALHPTLCAALDGVPLACAAAGMAHTVVASRDGAVYAMGWNINGQLGLGGPGADRQQSSSLAPALLEHPLLEQQHVVQVACGSRHTVALTASGQVFTWGFNKYGQCCTSSAADPPSARPNTGQTGPTGAAARSNACFVQPSPVAAAAAAPSSSSATAVAADVVEPHLVVFPAVVALPTQEAVCSTESSFHLKGSEEAADEQRQHVDCGCDSLQQHQCNASILVRIGKAVAVNAGRWHTCISVLVDS